MIEDHGDQAVQEPTLEELMADPLVRLLMKRDGVSLARLRRLARSVTRQRAARIAGTGPKPHLFRDPV